MWRFWRCGGRSWKTSDKFNGAGGIVGAITKQFHVCVIFSGRTAVHRWRWQLSKAPLDTRNFTRSFQPAVLRRADTTAETVTKSFVHYNEEHWFFCQQGSTRLLLQICHRHLCWCITVSIRKWRSSWRRVAWDRAATSRGRLPSLRCFPFCKATQGRLCAPCMHWLTTIQKEQYNKVVIGPVTREKKIFLSFFSFLDWKKIFFFLTWHQQNSQYSNILQPGMMKKIIFLQQPSSS